MPVMLAAFFLYKQQQIRHKMKEKLEQQYLQTIIVPAKDLVWVKYKKEIRVHDRLFDVKTIQLKDDRYYCTGLFDDDETLLNTFFTKAYEQPNDRKTPLVSQLFKLLHCLYPGGAAEEFAIWDLTEPCYLSFNTILISPSAEVPTPPPQF